MLVKYIGLKFASVKEHFPETIMEFLEVYVAHYYVFEAVSYKNHKQDIISGYLTMTFQCLGSYTHDLRHCNSNVFE